MQGRFLIPMIESDIIENISGSVRITSEVTRHA